MYILEVIAFCKIVMSPDPDILRDYWHLRLNGSDLRSPFNGGIDFIRETGYCGIHMPRRLEFGCLKFKILFKETYDDCFL